jgi:hypothetical protein
LDLTISGLLGGGELVEVMKSLEEIKLGMTETKEELVQDIKT